MRYKFRLILCALIGISLFTVANTLGVTMNLQEKYWPVYTTNWHQDKLNKSKGDCKYEQQFQNEIISRIHSYCNNPQ